MSLFQDVSNIGLGVANATAAVTLVDTKLNFIKKYGKTTIPYNKLDQLGNMKKNNIFMIVFVFSIILCIASFIYYKKTKKVNLTLLNKILYYLGWIFLIVTIIMLGYGGYFYFFLYLPQYNEWYSHLSFDGKNELALINTISDVASMTNRNNNINY